MAKEPRPGKMTLEEQEILVGYCENNETLITKAFRNVNAKVKYELDWKNLVIELNAVTAIPRDVKQWKSVI